MGDQVGQPQTSGSPICAVVITCNPDTGWLERLDAIAKEVSRFVVVDDHSDPAGIEMISRAVARHDGHLIQNATKRGHAGVLNQGAAWVFDQGFRWALVFDDDTLPRPGIASELLEIYQRASADFKIGIVGSNYYDDKQDKLRYRFADGRSNGWAVRTTVIASGSLIERDAFSTIGPFRDEFFVASIDHDFCLRARAKGLQVVISTRPLMSHSIGATTVHRLAGVSVTTTNHTAKRRYYMVRNHVTLLREHFLHEPKWVAQGCYALLGDVVRVMLFETDKAAKTRSMAVGAWHGFLGRLGAGPGDAR
ncbi:MAG: glycosyltransferase [Thermoanaerobaculales bacterium]